MISSSLCWSWAGIGYTVTVTSSRRRGRRFYQHSRRPRAFDFSALISPSTVYCIVLMGETTERSPLKYTLVFLCEFWRPRLLCRPAIPSVRWGSESILTPDWLTLSQWAAQEYQHHNQHQYRKLFKCSYQWRIKRTWLAMPSGLDLSLFDYPFSEHVSLFSSRLFSWPPHCFSSRLQALPPSVEPCVAPVFLSQCLLSAVCVVVMVVVLSLHLLVAEEVAPPAPRVVHLFGRPGTLHLPHLLHQIKTLS